MADSAELFRAAINAMAMAHAPYSQFPVGAALRTRSGKVFSGCNVENASFPEGWCAETSAISHMIAAGEREIVEVAAVAAKMPLITPCGGCRQRLKEFGASTTLVHLCDTGGVVKTVTLGELLPYAFALA